MVRRTSLLPAGVTGVEGPFEAGDPVDLCDEGGSVVARGVVNFDAAEIPGLMGRSTRWLARELGPGYEREIVHRDDLVVLAPRQPAPVPPAPPGLASPPGPSHAPPGRVSHGSRATSRRATKILQLQRFTRG